MIQRRVDSVTERLFGNGLGFFAPYILIYLAAWVLRLELSFVRFVFVVVHLALGTLFIIHCIRRRRLFEPTSALFWVGLTLMFLLPGAYLEYPDDPWEHIRRIFGWEQASSIGDSVVRLRFASFWMWSMIADLAVPTRRLALSVLSCFWQLLLAFQVYRFSRALGYDAIWARVQVVGTLCLLGTNLFSFYRYHALASTPLAYCAYLAATALLVRSLGLSAGGEMPEDRAFSPGRMSWIAFLIVIMILNHRQELLFFFVAGGTLVLVRGWRDPRWRVPITAGLGFMAVGSLVFAGWNMSHQDFVKLGQWFPWAEHAMGWFDPSIWQRLLNAWGRGLGLHHALAVVVAVALVRKAPTIAWLTIVPVVMMFFPPVILLTTALHGSSGEWLNERLPLALSGSFILAEAIRLWLEPRHRRRAVAVAVVVLVVLGLPPWQPFRGRLWFQLQSSPTSLELQPMDATVEWMRRHRLGQLTPTQRSDFWVADWAIADEHMAQLRTLLALGRCVLVADGATTFAVSAQLGLHPGTVRRRSEWPERLPHSPEALERWSASRGVCAFLVAEPDRWYFVPTSTVASLAGRRDGSVVRNDLMTPGACREAVGPLVSVGWTATAVPPFYTLYEPPDHPISSAPAHRIWAGLQPDPGELFSDGFETRDLSAWTASDG